MNTVEMLSLKITNRSDAEMRSETRRDTVWLSMDTPQLDAYLRTQARFQVNGGRFHQADKSVVPSSVEADAQATSGTVHHIGTAAIFLV